MIRQFLNHPKAAGLLMIFMVITGIAALTRINTQFFPGFEISIVKVSVAWPGASAEDVDINILDVLVPEFKGIADVIRTTSVARESGAVIRLEFKSAADMQKAQADVEQAVSRVTTLPRLARKPEITREQYYERAATIALTGPLPEKRLKAISKQIRDGLLAAGIDRVRLTGARAEEIRVRVREPELRRLKLSIEDIARQIRDNTVHLPGGLIEDKTQLRLLSDRSSPDAIGAMAVKSLPTGEKVLLKDIGKITSGFDRNDNIGLMRGMRAFKLEVQRASDTDLIETKKAMDALLKKIRPQLPPVLKIIVYDVHADFVKKCIAILIENALLGFLLVLAMLFIFLKREVAFWIAVSIPVVLMATLGGMYSMGLSINVISILALLMMLGVIVDDSIIIGEHYATLRGCGLSRRDAAERGARFMLIAVLAGALTTLAGFFPILLITGRVGAIMSAIPLVVFAVLVASIIECFFVLPGHLTYSSPVRSDNGWFRERFDKVFSTWRDGFFRRLLEKSYSWRYTTIALAMTSLLLSLGLLSGGHVKFNFFASPEAENIRALIKFRPGTTTEDKMAVLGRIEASLYEMEKALLSEENGTKRSSIDIEVENRLIVTSFITLNRDHYSDSQNTSIIEVQLTPSEGRSIRTKLIGAAWREAMPELANVARISIRGRRSGPPGRDIDVQISNAPVEQLKLVADRIRQALLKFAGVSAIADDLPWGKEELIIALKPRGLSLGFTNQNVGTQLRNAFEGAIATRFAQGDEEITIRVMADDKLPGRAALRDLYLVSPTGHRVPLTEVVTLTERTGFSRIQRRDGVRTVSITADIDREVGNLTDVLSSLATGTLEPLVAKHGIKYRFGGRAEERRNSFRDLGLAGTLSLALIYLVLVLAFNSYLKPLVIMAIIPFTLIGVIVGHWIMGFNISIISLIGLLGLSGIVVNGSIILCRQIDQRINDGDNIEEAVIGASQDRLRAVILTSLTTICGLAPLLFETSRQAQFLIPMAITQVFGLAVVSVLVLFLVPALLGIGRDLTKLYGALSGTGLRAKLQTR